MKKIIALFLLLLFTVGMFSACDTGSKSNEAETTTLPADETAVEGEAKIIDIPLTDAEYVIAVKKSDAALLQKVNAYIEKVKTDGTLDEIVGRYFGEGEKNVIVSAEESEEGNQLVVAADSGKNPFEATEGDGFIGIDMELAKGLANELGRELVIKDVRTDSFAQMLENEEIDLAVSRITADMDMGEAAAFSVPYYDASQVLIVPLENTDFDSCTDAEEIMALLEGLTTDKRIGVQKYAEGQYFVIGDEEGAYEGFQAECVPYPNCRYAVENMLSGDVDLVITDLSAAQPVLDSFNNG